MGEGETPMRIARGTRCHLAGAAVASIVALATLGCGGDERTPQAAERTEGTPAPAAGRGAGAAPGGTAAVAEARQIFDTRCATCHGPEGRGDGPGSAGLSPKPRNFQDADWQASVSDAHIEQIVLYGGAAVGKSPTMPGNPDLTGKPAVTAALVEHVRGLAKR